MNKFIYLNILYFFLFYIILHWMKYLIKYFYLFKIIKIILNKITYFEKT